MPHGSDKIQIQHTCIKYIDAVHINTRTIPNYLKTIWLCILLENLNFSRGLLKYTLLLGTSWDIT